MHDTPAPSSLSRCGPLCQAGHACGGTAALSLALILMLCRYKSLILHKPLSRKGIRVRRRCMLPSLGSACRFRVLLAAPSAAVAWVAVDCAAGPCVAAGFVLHARKTVPRPCLLPPPSLPPPPPPFP
jgi:hypothetical protein